MTTSKKPKTANDNDDFETVKRYLLDCPHVTSDHPAIRAALEGIEKEQKRRERDAKLQRKFASTTTASATASATSSNNSAAGSNLSDSVVVVDENAAPSATLPDDPDEMMEWQDVSEKSKDDEEDESSDCSSFLGKKLAKLAIDSIARHQVKVKSPVAAIAVVLHACLRSDTLGFSCTGIPEDEKKSGFAAPVRELPKTQFLPFKWDESPNKVALRYRKNGTGALILITQLDTDQKVQITFQPTANKEPSSQLLSFAIEEHVNLDSWNAALKVSSSISPALHYKSLATLLSNFLRTYDLGAVDEEVLEQNTVPYVDNTVPSSQFSGHPRVFKSDFVPSTNPIPSVADEGRRNKPWKDGVPVTLDQAFPGVRPLQPGDFHNDIAPGGLMDPRFVRDPSGRMGGNLMGPNHPMFVGGGIHRPSVGGPGSMQPRFDPFHPPGIDDDIGGRARRNRPSRSGEPNPDHLPPPNLFGNDMYM